MVEENVATASRSDPPSQEEAQRVLDILEKNRRWEGLYCTGCNYCMPCAKGIDIPANFSALNLFTVWALEKLAKREYADLGATRKDGEPAPRRSETCTECGECEPKCPQDIPITKRLREVSQTLSPNNPV